MNVEMKEVAVQHWENTGRAHTLDNLNLCTWSRQRPTARDRWNQYANLTANQHGEGGEHGRLQGFEQWRADPSEPGSSFVEFGGQAWNSAREKDLSIHSTVQTNSCMHSYRATD